MPPTPPALQLASRLRQLREQIPRLTQKKLADALSADESLSAATVSSWESLTSPKLPPPYRMDAYARFFATSRSTQGTPKLLPLDEFDQDETKTYERLKAELTRLRAAASGESPAEVKQVFNRSWLFQDVQDGDPITFVCAVLPERMIGPLGDSADPNYTELQTYADADALIELFGHIRAENPSATVHFKTSLDVEPDELTGHVILLGGVVWNEITGQLSEMANVPIRQVKEPPLDSGEIFVGPVEGEERTFWPKWTDKSKKVLMEDVGLLARVPNPLNASRTLTICNGIHSRGVYGAVRALTDKQMRESNERYISTNFGDAQSFAILMSVKVIKNRAMTPDFNSPDVVLCTWGQVAG
jgi:hypothetical protein